MTKAKIYKKESCKDCAYVMQIGYEFDEAMKFEGKLYGCHKEKCVCDE